MPQFSFRDEEDTLVAVKPNCLGMLFLFVPIARRGWSELL